MAKLKLTDELGKLIIEHIKVGNSIEDAAEACGVTSRSIQSWLADGEKAHQGIFRRFYEAVQRAKATPKVIAVGKLFSNVLDRDQRAIEFWLSRKHPDEWGAQKTVKTEITNIPQITMFLPENERDNV